MTKHFLTLRDLSAKELEHVLTSAAQLKATRGQPGAAKPLLGKSIALVFEKASTRTRMSFEVGVHELGAHPVVLMGRDTQIDRGEPLEDTARMFSRFVHAVVFRTHGHDRVEKLAAASSVPVVNSLSDLHHPCQLLADLLTIREAFGRNDQLKVAWVGDGNNMAHSWIEAATLMNFELCLACPKGYTPNAHIMAWATEHKARVTVTDDPHAAVKEAHVVTTDVWTSMGQENEAQARLKAFAGYEVDERMMADANKDAIFLHCLPAHRGEEVSAKVLEGAQSRVWDEAENRLHSQKALLIHLLARV